MNQANLIEAVNACMTEFRKDRLRYQIDSGDIMPDKFPDHLTRQAEAAAIVAIVRERDPFIINLLEAANQAREYIDGAIDVVDGSYGEPAPNGAMSLASLIDEAVAPFEKAASPASAERTP